MVVLVMAVAMLMGPVCVFGDDGHYWACSDCLYVSLFLPPYIECGGAVSCYKSDGTLANNNAACKKLTPPGDIQKNEQCQAKPSCQACAGSVNKYQLGPC